MLPETWDWERFTATATVRGVATPVLASFTDCRTNFGLDIPTAPVTALRAAAASREEKRAWTLAQYTFYQPRRLLAQAQALETSQERMILARGALGWYFMEGWTWALRRLRLARNHFIARWRRR